MTRLLQENNWRSPSDSDCDYLSNASFAWLQANAFDAGPVRFVNEDKQPRIHLLWAEILPVRCSSFPGATGVITAEWCEIQSNTTGYTTNDQLQYLCSIWSIGSSSSVPADFAQTLNVREGEITSRTKSLEYEGQTYVVNAMFDESLTVESV